MLSACISRACWSVLFLMFTVAAGIDPVLAQQQGLTPNDVNLSRQLRSLEYQARTSPGANLTPQVQRARRDLVQRSGGVAFTPEQARIDRGLTQLGRQVQQERSSAIGVPAGPARRVEPLPSSIATDQPLPSFHRAATVGRLIGRAETAVAEGRSVQARSDLDTARSLMAGVQADDPDGGSELATFQARMAAVEARLGSPDG